MIVKIKVSSIIEKSKSRPNGYSEDVFSRGELSDGYLFIEESEYLFLLKKYRQNAPTIAEQFKGLTGALFDFAKSGFEIANESLYLKRHATCAACEKWNPSAFGGSGKCSVCGCSKLKQIIAVAKCPLGKW